MKVDCNERDGLHEREIRKLENDIAIIADLVDCVKKVPNFLYHSPAREFENYRLFLNDSNQTFLVDDVGVLVAIPCHCGAEVHITFWDGRLRGREELCRKVADGLLRQFKWLVTAIPTDRLALIAFAKRVGFVELSRQDDIVVMKYPRV